MRHPPVLFDEAFDFDGLVRLRAMVAACVRTLGAGAHVDDVVLVAHELCGNAVKHGGGSGRLRVWRDDTRVFCRVSDRGPGVPGVVGIEAPSHRTAGGRGLWIARRLAEVEIESGPTGTTVTAAIPISSAHPKRTSPARRPISDAAAERPTT